MTTSSPAPTPSARSASCSASVPFATATASRAPSAAASSRSKASPSGPRMNQPESSTRAIAASSSPRSSRTRAAKSTNGTFTGSARGGGGSSRLSRRSPSASGTHGRPAERSAHLRGVRVEVADVDPLALGREGHQPVAAAARDCSSSSFDQLEQRDGLVVPEVEHLPVRGVQRAGAQEGLDDVVDVVEVALLLAVAEELDLLAERRLAHEPADEALAVVPDQLPRPVGVGQPQRRGADAVHLVVDQVVELARDLVDPVHVHRLQQVILVDRQVERAAVDLARAGVDDLQLGVVLAHGLEHAQLARAVDLEVGHRVGHRVDVAHLAGEVEEHLLPAHEVLHAVPAHVGDVDADLVLVAGEVEQVAAVVGQQAVDRGHVRADVRERPAQVRADEAEPAGDEHAAALVELAVVAHGLATSAGRVGRGCARCRA